MDRPGGDSSGNTWRVQIVKAIDLSQDSGRTTQVWDAEVKDEVSGKTIALFPCTQLKVIRFRNDEVLWTLYEVRLALKIPLKLRSLHENKRRDRTELAAALYGYAT